MTQADLKILFDHAMDLSPYRPGEELILRFHKLGHADYTYCEAKVIARFPPESRSEPISYIVETCGAFGCPDTVRVPACYLHASARKRSQWGTGL